jgi:hypothetical protein
VTDDTTYNGWTNYETWAVALWLGSEPGTYEDCRAMARAALAEAQGDAQAASRPLADAAKEYVNELPDVAAVLERPSLAADLLGGALSAVNWREIAEHLTDDEEPAP